MEKNKFDVVIIGGGIVGLSTAMALIKNKKLRLAVIEAEAELALHQTGNNSGVIHSGLYYKPGSLKARNCVEGRKRLVAFCEKTGIPFDPCGKLVVATTPEERSLLDELERRGNANGLEGMKRLRPEELREHEPHVAGIDGLFVPETGIVDYREVSRAYGRIVTDAGGLVETGVRFLDRIATPSELVLETTGGTMETKFLVNCGGLHSDRIARKCGIDPGVQIVPFRGEYYRLGKKSRHLVRNLIYPVPNPNFPFLGVHFTRMITGGVEAGPNAVLAFKREGYRKTDISLTDTIETLSFPGFIKLAAKYWKTGLGEFYRSMSKLAFVKALQRLMPELSDKDLVPGGAGVRAQALKPDGTLLDDFHVIRDRRAIHVLNAPSPAATASISIGETVAEMARKNFGHS
jgi:(S)-2-hydroxyglutarate dehydrogenase